MTATTAERSAEIDRRSRRNARLASWGDRLEDEARLYLSLVNRGMMDDSAKQAEFIAELVLSLVR